MLLADRTDAFARAKVVQRPASLLRIVHFRGGDLVYDRDDELVLSMALTVEHSLEYVTSGCRTSVLPVIGQFGLMTPARRFRIALRGDCSVIQLVMPRGVLATWLSEDHAVDGTGVEIGWGHGLSDPAISRLLLAAGAEEPDGQEPFLRLVAARLLARFAARPRPIASVRGGLSPRHLRRVIEVMDDPAASPTIHRLASEVCLSPYHFARQFCRTTGRSPHRFLLERKVARAIGLMKDKRLSLDAIAAASGFAHSSHLARQCRRTLGRSPTQLRRAILS